MSVNSKMTAIADQIRTLLGLTGTMGLDEMAAHLGTEQSNVTAALAAIADKGVTVPDGSNSDSLAALIAAIEAGGGGEIITGSFIANSSGIVNVEHNLGKKPSFVFIYFEPTPLETCKKYEIVTMLSLPSDELSGNTYDDANGYFGYIISFNVGTKTKFWDADSYNVTSAGVYLRSYKAFIEKNGEVSTYATPESYEIASTKTHFCVRATSSQPGSSGGLVTGRNYKWIIM